MKMWWKWTLVLIFSSIHHLSDGKTFNPKTSQDFQKSIDATTGGDTIQLEEGDYIGDFVLDHSGGGKSHPISIIGQHQEDGAATTRILANRTAILIRGNYWFLKDLNVSAVDEGIVIEGNNNHVESVAVFEAFQAITVLGNENEFGSISISNVRDGIVIDGNDNLFRDLICSNSSTGILIEKGDRNNLHNLAVNNKAKEGLSLLLEKGTCCGRLTNVVLNGLANVNGNNYYFRQVIANEAINIIGCSNTFGRSVFSRTYFTKECDQNFRASNIYHFPQNQPVQIKDI